MTEASDAASRLVGDRVRASFERQRLMRLLGAELALVDVGKVVITLPRRPEVSQQDGFVHAGATGAIGDTAGGYAALTLMPEGYEVLSVEYKLNLLAPATGDLEAVGTVLRPGRTLTVSRVGVYSTSGGERTHVASGQRTLIGLSRQ